MSKQKQSIVWNHFIISEDDKSKAECNHCKKLISRGGMGKAASTTPLFGHLKNVHLPEFVKLSEEKEKTNPENGRKNGRKVSNKQLSLEQIINKKKSLG